MHKNKKNKIFLNNNNLKISIMIKILKIMFKLRLKILINKHKLHQLKTLFYLESIEKMKKSQFKEVEVIFRVV
jgi:hypothetical protein